MYMYMYIVSNIHVHVHVHVVVNIMKRNEQKLVNKNLLQNVPSSYCYVIHSQYKINHVIFLL